eukprot:CAMPEP_0114483102 /NCGR_PEP_ID=MMETSP0104-20121206/18669_1 /TAXON_ID=37642 ORGANISM="Paraphysomonas imperforata, Strain PA2" /NCGR_SAMPLE_ID=MMETSP0104 /ASSEMBLY_ACC=CAM_ASM_000202 /LENGTH=87 /DNA_ID=CAMNT_0001658997 /DNA_START=319 /DNA_END=582 /DNA_ORIENTATION=+
MNAPNSDVKLNLLAMYPSKKSVRLAMTKILAINSFECEKNDMMKAGMAVSRINDKMLGALRRMVIAVVGAGLAGGPMRVLSTSCWTA